LGVVIQIICKDIYSNDFTTVMGRLYKEAKVDSSRHHSNPISSEYCIQDMRNELYFNI
jgi:hypothetical protein